MALVLQDIHKKLDNPIKSMFTKITLNCRVVTVNLEKEYFTIESDQKELDCYTKENISNLNSGMALTVTGCIFLNPYNNNQIALNVQNFWIISENRIYEKEFWRYKKNESKLNSKNYMQKIANADPNNPPKTIFNVVLLALDEQGTHLENFKKLFSEKCTGKLYVYHLMNKLSIPISYFSKNHNIDLICILTSKLSPENMFRLSSKDNLRTILDRKKCPYLISVTCDKTTAPLISKITKQNFDQVEQCVDFIQNIQTTYEQSIKDSIADVKNILVKILEKKRKTFNRFRMLLTSLADPKFNTINLERIKNTLINRLMTEKMKLYNIQSVIMKKIIDDERCQNFFGLLINNEKELGKIVNEPLANEPLANEPLLPVCHLVNQINTEKIENKKADITIDHSSNYNQNDKY